MSSQIWGARGAQPSSALARALLRRTSSTWTGRGTGSPEPGTGIVAHYSGARWEGKAKPRKLWPGRPFLGSAVVPHRFPSHCAFALLTVGSGCPQLLDDRFESAGGNATGGSWASINGAGGAGNAGDAGGAGLAGGSGGVADAGGTGGRYGFGGDTSDAGCSLGSDCGGRSDSGNPDPCGVGESRGPLGYCYFKSLAARTLEVAREECQARGARWDLAAIRSQADNEFVQGLVTDELLLGGTDAAEEGKWLWMRDTTPFFDVAGVTGNLYSNWSAGEPNDYSDQEDCVRMLPAGTWADFECEDSMRYVCQRFPS